MWIIVLAAAIVGCAHNRAETPATAQGAGPGMSAATTAQQRALLLSGGIDATGTPHLDPAFVLDAPPSPPEGEGRHTITGRDANGAELFSLRFEMPVIADGDGSSSFVFAVPVEEGWAERLASITLDGPGGSFTLDRSTDRPMAIPPRPRNRTDPADHARPAARASGAGGSRGAGGGNGIRALLQPRDPRPGRTGGADRAIRQSQYDK